MAGHNKYDARLDSLVIETRTLFDESIAQDVGEQDRLWLADAVHAEPSLAAKIHYERAHTGFTREITVTQEDIARLYRQRQSAAGGELLDHSASAETNL
ncbi:hypothetical protein [Calycomorphotria hydatis]|uniref:Uncharacterized protein n=1 Tax=Calycomorphotria hydatis TaxID=2528027 RepID=A0A517TDT1_9PLAN|nr:hypothetical protein [Calycomorphotria hydatis]QDT66533.1 hypothetical protein V22_38030 [Calycomorphotria hydatis]